MKTSLILTTIAMAITSTVWAGPGQIGSATLDLLKECRASDEQLLLSSRNHREVAWNSSATATGVRAYFRAVEIDGYYDAPEDEVFANKLYKIIDSSNDCTEINKKLAHFFKAEALKPAAKAEEAKILADIRKRFPKIKRVLKDMGLKNAAKTTTDNEFLLNLSANLDGLDRLFGGRPTNQITEAITFMYNSDLEEQREKAKATNRNAFDNLRTKLGLGLYEGVDSENLDLIELEKNMDEAIALITDEETKRNKKLTAQQIEFALVKAYARDIVKRWQEELDRQ